MPAQGRAPPVDASAPPALSAATNASRRARRVCPFGSLELVRFGTDATNGHSWVGANAEAVLAQTQAPAKTHPHTQAHVPAHPRRGFRPSAAPRLWPVTNEFHKPTMFSGAKFDSMIGGDDPANISRVAHETAQAILARVRDAPDAAVVERLVAFTDEHGIDAIAELWSSASPRSLPGALWRIYLLRALIRQDPDGSSYLYTRGAELTPTIDPVVAGATTPTGPAEIIRLADEILRGLFAGDFAVALERASAFCRVTATGATHVADDAELTNPDRASALTRQALRLSATAVELTACARSWRSGSLD